ncbi:MAG: 2'-5' RNA ligase family protein [Haloarculaceae archaeon]
MYSLNVPVPDEVSRLAAGLGLTCQTADVRTRPTLVGKRLGDGAYGPLAREARDVVAGTAPFAARVTSIDAFQDPPNGRAPVVYLTVESPGLDALHDRLCAAFDPVPRMEGEAYDPHVTIARGGDARDLLDESIDPISWSVDHLVFWDGAHHEPVESVALPA